MTAAFWGLLGFVALVTILAAAGVHGGQVSVKRATKRPGGPA